MSRCATCGQQPSRRARFCPTCGTVLTVAGGVGTTLPRRWSGTTIATSGVVAIAAVVVVLTGLTGLNLPGSTEPAAPGSTGALIDDTLADDTLAGNALVGDTLADGAPGDAVRIEVPDAVDVVGTAGGDVIAAAPIGGDEVLLLHTDRRLQRVRLPRRSTDGTGGDPVVRWERTLVDAAPIDPATGVTASGAGGPSLTVDEALVLVGDARGVSAVTSEDGTARWRVELPGAASGPGYRAWRIGGHVMAANRFHLAVIEADTGRAHWSIERPAGDVQPMQGGVAVIAPDIVRAYTPERDEPVWSLRRATPNRGAFGVVDRAAGPVVVDGRAAVTLDARDGRLLIKHGIASVVTRAGDTTVVAAEWETAAGAPMLAGYAPDGTERWRTPGPDVRCCELLLRPTQDGRVLAATIGRGRTEVGWLLDPADGRVTATVQRPPIAAALPIGVGEDVSVWLDGDGLLGAALDTGEVRWRADAGTVLLSEAPLVLRTPDGLVRP